MTHTEVRDAVLAIRQVVEKHGDEFSVESSTETSIVVMGGPLIERFRFDPTKLESGAFTGMYYMREYMCCCKTPGPAQLNAGICEMIHALQKAVTHKLCVTG